MDGTVETGCARYSLAQRLTGRRWQLCLCAHEEGLLPIVFEVPQAVSLMACAAARIAPSCHSRDRERRLGGTT
jgi:hypothetical protein